MTNLSSIANRTESTFYDKPYANLIATGIKEVDTVGEDVVFGDLLYMNSDEKWWKADADSLSTMPGMRLALETVLANNNCNLLVLGRVRNNSWSLTRGGLIYASTPAGSLTQTAPSGAGDQVQVVGVAYSGDEIIFNPSLTIAEVA